MKEKRPKVKIGLLIETTTDRDSYLGDYFHVRAHPVTIGPTTWEQQYRQQRIDSGRTDDSYRDIQDDTIRNPSDDLHNGLRLDSLRVNSQGRNADDPRHLYAWEIEYKDIYSIDLRRAESMAKTLRHIDQVTRKLEEKYGRPTTFGQYIGRIAVAIGADSIVFVDGSDRGWHHKNGHRHFNLGDGISRIDGMVRAWVDERMIQAPEHRQTATAGTE